MTIAVALCGTLGLAMPSLAAAGSISGTVTAEGGGPIQGVEVCTRSEPFSFESPCAQTDGSGAYKIDGLPAASYHVAFFTYVDDLNYVPESYNDKPLNLAGGDLVPVGAAQDVTGIDAELEEGGIIEGSAEDGETHGPGVGVEVCASTSFPADYYSACGITGSDGSYAINALTTGEYTVSFEGGNDANYLRRWYDEAEFSAGATEVPLIAGDTVTGIDAVLQPGSQVLGRVTEAGTGASLKDVEVCVYDPLSVPSVEPCDWTDSAGNYAIRSLPASTYRVVFSQEPNPEFILDDTYFEQWWQGAGSVNEATPIALTPPGAATGIDAQLVNMIQRPQPKGIEVTIVPRPNPPPKKCRKGFHRKKVKGKVRCVRKHRKHKNHRKHPHSHKQRGQGPVATR